MTWNAYRGITRMRLVFNVYVLYPTGTEFLRTTYSSKPFAAF